MRRDIAPDFRKIITIVPDDVLKDMRRDFQNSKHSGKEAVKKIILVLSVELLRRKWGGRLRWERTGAKV